MVHQLLWKPLPVKPVTMSCVEASMNNGWLITLLLLPDSSLKEALFFPKTGN